MLEQTLDPNPMVNRNLIREDYWMDWIDDVVGVRLNWNHFDNGNGLTETEQFSLKIMDEI